MNTTNHHSLKTLTKTVLGKLENRKFIEFNPKVRNDLQEQLYQKLGKLVLTEEDIVSHAREDVSKIVDVISDQNLTEGEAFQSQKRALKSKYSDNMVAGFYLTDTLRSISMKVCKFLFETDLVEEVFESDDAIQKLVMETIQNFDESKIA